MIKKLLDFTDKRGLFTKAYPINWEKEAPLIKFSSLNTDKSKRKESDYTNKKNNDFDLATDSVREEIFQRKMQLNLAIDYVERQLKHIQPGTLRISNRNGIKQYYHRKEASDTIGKYIRKQDYERAVELAQQDYNQKILKALKKELEIIESFNAEYKPDNLAQVYLSLHENRKELIQPLILTDEEYVRQWKSVEYSKMGFRDNMPEYYTDEGERVRSKSEIIIANKMTKKTVPYRYEYPIELSDYRVVHPDFYCLNVRTRKEYIWEHFGMMDQPDYAISAVKKIEAYEKEGYYIGVNFIATFETTESPLNMILLEKTIDEFLL